LPPVATVTVVPEAVKVNLSAGTQPADALCKVFGNKIEKSTGNRIETNTKDKERVTRVLSSS
jgi:hypothetical protein